MTAHRPRLYSPKANWRSASASIAIRCGTPSRNSWRLDWWIFRTATMSPNACWTNVSARTPALPKPSALGLATDCRLNRKQAITATRGVARQLAIAMDEPVVWIETLRHADGRPVCPISHFLPMRDFSSLLGTCESGSLHEHLGSMFGCVLRRAESLVTAVLPKGEDAKLLAIPRNRSARCCGKRASTSTRAAIVPSSMPSRAFAQTGFNYASISDRAFSNQPQEVLKCLSRNSPSPPS